MSEEQAVDDNPYTDGLVEQEESTPEQAGEQAPAKAESSPKGHMSREAWEAKGNDPDKYRTPEEFEAAGPNIRQVDRLKQENARLSKRFDEQLVNVNMLHRFQKGQLEQTITDLEGRRNNAIDEADTAEANQLQSQIDTARGNKNLIEAQEVAQQHQEPEKDASVVEWEANNPWIQDNSDPKTPYAMQQFNLYQSQGKDIDQALAMVNNDISRNFPNVNHARSTAAVAEGAQGPGATSRAKSNSVTMANLTREESLVWDSMGASFGSEKAFLQSVADSRKGDK